MRRFTGIFLIVLGVSAQAGAASVEVNLDVLDKLRGGRAPVQKAVPKTPEPRNILRAKPENPPVPKQQQAKIQPAPSVEITPLPSRKPAQAPSSKVAKAPVTAVEVEILHKPEAAATAAIEPAAGAQDMKLSLQFEPSQLSLGQSQMSVLGEDKLAALKNGGNQRIQIYSFATSETGSESDARRISLTRALEIRAILVGHDIDSRRIDIIAMGDPKSAEASPENQSADRIDIVTGQPSGTL